MRSARSTDEEGNIRRDRAEPQRRIAALAYEADLNMRLSSALAVHTDIQHTGRDCDFAALLLLACLNFPYASAQRLGTF